MVDHAIASRLRRLEADCDVYSKACGAIFRQIEERSARSDGASIEHKKRPPEAPSAHSRNPGQPSLDAGISLKKFRRMQLLKADAKSVEAEQVLGSGSRMDIPGAHYFCCRCGDGPNSFTACIQCGHHACSSCAIVQNS